MKVQSKIILRLHASILSVITIALTIVGAIGYYQGRGPFGDLFTKEPIGYIGLFQAYMLMNVLAIVLFLGSRTANTNIWHLVGILAHIYPFAANLLFWYKIETYGISHGGIILHLTFMLLESYGYFRSTN